MADSGQTSDHTPGQPSAQTSSLTSGRTRRSPEHDHGFAPLSLRARLVIAGLVLCLAATSAAVWASPTLRRDLVSDVLDAAPLPARGGDSVRGHALSRHDEAMARRHAAAEAAKAARKAQAKAAAEAARRARAQAGPLTPLMGVLTTPAAPRHVVTGHAARGQSAPRKAPPSPTRRPVRNAGAGAHGVVAAGGVAAARPEQHCWQFPYQQDAQTAYAKNPRDPFGLDGPPGLRNDDGLACTDLPVDPKRRPSRPLWPHVEPMPTAPSPAAAVAPEKTYFGVFSPEAPFHFAEVDRLAAAIGHIPSSVTWFSGWDEKFRSDGALAAWRRGMLPIVSWESRPQVTDTSPGSDNAVNSDYQLSDIINGRYDDYIRAYARDIAAFGMPVGLRFDHEMNGVWYPWSEQVNGNKPGQFAAAWRHVHRLFAAEGADNVIWIWAPNTIEFPQAQPLKELYPGDAYVDWLGLVGYYRKAIEGKPATFANTYGKSLEALRELAPGKPIHLTEIGATETGGKKVAWIRSLFAALPRNPDIVGFTWFTLRVTSTPLGESKPVTNDWRIDSSPAALRAFAEGISNPRYSAGRPAPTRGGAAPAKATPEPSPAATAKATPEPSPAATAKATPEPSPPVLPTATPEPSPPVLPTATHEATPTPSPTATPETTPDASATATSEASAAPTPAGLANATATATPEASPEPTPEASAEPTREASAEPTPEASPTAIRGGSPEPTPEGSPDASPTATPERSPEPTPEGSLEPSAEAWPKASAGGSTGATPQPSAKPTPRGFGHRVVKLTPGPY